MLRKLTLRLRKVAVYESLRMTRITLPVIVRKYQAKNPKAGFCLRYTCIADNLDSVLWSVGLRKQLLCFDRLFYILCEF